MIDDLRAFIERPAVRVVVCAVLISYLGFDFILTALTGFGIRPLTVGLTKDELGFVGLLREPGTVFIHGREVDWLGPVAALLTFAAGLAVAGLIWPDDDDVPTSRCPHCTSSIPSAASVCWACTQEIAA